MLNENLKAVRKAKGLSQEELAGKLNVVRQTISKWEQGLSVPDSNMLVTLSEALETPVSVLLGETVTEPKADTLQVISKKLEIIDLQLALSRDEKRKKRRLFYILSCTAILIIYILLIKFGSPYLSWDYSDPETAVVGVALHAFEWIFVRLAPLALIGSIVGLILTRKKI